MFQLQLDSALSRSLSHNLTDHLSIRTHYDMSEHETYYLSSKHADILEKEDVTRACFRLKTLLRLLNSSLSLCGSSFEWKLKNSPVVESLGFFYIDERDDATRIYPEPSLEIELEELENPFENSVEIDFRNGIELRRNKIMHLAFLDPLVRENLLLYSLSNEDPLYILVNIYKILDTIKFDKASNLSQVEPSKITGLNAQIARFESENLRHFINTRDGSGFLARHGADQKVFRKSKPTFEQLIDATHDLLNTWIDIKLSINSL